MTFGELPEDHAVTLCPETASNLRAVHSVTAEQDRGFAVWCGQCRFERGVAGALGALLVEWPLLAAQEVPKMGQFYEHAGAGLWKLREIV